VISGDVIRIEDSVRVDEKYAWSESLSYYIDKYNLRLPPDFEKQILGIDYHIIGEPVKPTRAIAEVFLKG